MEANHPCMTVTRAPGPYPEVRAGGRNYRYAHAMLSNLSGEISEMSAMSLYLYDQLVTVGIPELSAVFQELALVELRHMEIFGMLAQQLGADPRLWCMRRGRQSWWSPADLQYTRKLGPLIHGAIRAEEQTIRKYKGQLCWIRDENVTANLTRIIQDEQVHLQVLTQLAQIYTGQSEQ